MSIEGQGIGPESRNTKVGALFRGEDASVQNTAEKTKILYEREKTWTVIR